MIYRQLAWIKCTFLESDYQEIPEAQKIKFKFKKAGFKHLVLFDLDETLIHCRRGIDEIYEEDDDFELDECI